MSLRNWLASRLRTFADRIEGVDPSAHAFDLTPEEALDALWRAEFDKRTGALS